jgi:hypothetical protein
MKALKSLSIVKPVILVKLLEDERLLVIDSESTIRFYNKDDFKLESGFKVKIVHERFQTKVVDYSNDAQFFATLSADCRESRLYNTTTKKIIARVTRHQGEVSCVGIDPLSRYMFSCGDDGKTFALDTRSGKFVFTLPHHADTINDIAFSKNGNWIATGGYDKKIQLFNLVTMVAKDKFRAHAAAIMKLKFFGKNKLISIDKNSKAIIWNIYSGKVIERLQGIHDDVTQIVTAEDDKFLFIGTKLGYVLVYDLVTYEQLSSKFIKITSPISAMHYDEVSHHLIIGTEDGFLMYYYIYENEVKLKEYLMNKNMDAIEEEVKKNPILKYTDIYDMVSNLWENALAKAKLAFQSGQKEKALLMLKSFQDIPSKNRVIQKLVKEYAEYEKFVQLAKQGKIALAYSLANQHPIYKESNIYKQLEQRWKKLLHEALKFALQPRGLEKAREILAPYRGVSEKTVLIQEVLSKGEVYKRFKDALMKKDFRIASELIKQHAFLKEFPEYESMMRYADNLYMKAEKLIYDGKNVEAMKLLHLLANFTDFEEEVRELSKSIDAKQKFYDAIEEKNYAIAYNMMTINEDLEDTPIGKKLLQEWNKDLDRANSFAANGNVSGVKKVLGKYFHVSSKYGALATVFAWCYINQLENAVRSKYPRNEIEKGIKNYVLNFGVDDQIEMFLELYKLKYPDSKLDIEHLKKGSLSMWRPSMIVDSILE